MIRFESDYLEGALPEVMQALSDTNYAQTPGYGEDEYCARRRGDDTRKVRRARGRRPLPRRRHAGELDCHRRRAPAAPGRDSRRDGHIAVHETGSVEATGHKVITLPERGRQDKRRAGARVRRGPLGRRHARAQPQPALVYISQPTENGTSTPSPSSRRSAAVCREKGLIFFVDGARLGTALVSRDVTPRPTSRG